MVKENQNLLTVYKRRKLWCNKKFENIGLQELLLTTEENLIIWNDPNDNILGTGFSGGGDNFVGTYLGKLRTKFKKNDNQSINMTQEDISNIIGKRSYYSLFFIR